MKYVVTLEIDEEDLEGDDFAGMCHHLRNLYRIFGIKDGIERWENYSKKAQAVKTKKENAWFTAK